MHEPTPQPRPTKTRRWLTAVVAVLGALGIFGAVGAYYVPGILDRIGAEVTDRQPIEYDLIMDRTETPNYVFPEAVDPDDFLATADEGGADLEAWVRKHGGVLADMQTVRLVLWGRDSTVVHVEDVRVKVINRTAPRAGWYNANEGCGSGIDPRKVEVDLDTSPPKHTWLVNGGDGQRPAFTISESDEETFDVTVYTTRDEVQWIIEVAYTSSQGSGTLRVDNHGKPFLTTTLTNAVAYALDYDAAVGSMIRTPEADGSKLSADDHPVC